ncbi:MAG: hypothetical protein KAH25_03580 [Bacteroidales bacterium]|nr:hypothetical protein [Bacteroidales bacterium]
MKTILLIISFIIINIELGAQQHSYDYLASKYCNEAEKIDFNKLDKTQIIEANIKLSNRLRQENSDTIEYILQKIHSNNDTLSQMEALIIYSKQYIHDIIYNCDSYLKINRLSIESCPKETKSLQYITIRVNKYLAQHPEYSYKQVLDSAGIKGFEYGKDIPEQLIKDYDFEYVYPNILINYLLHHSDIFFRAWLYNQSMKLFN